MKTSNPFVVTIVLLALGVTLASTSAISASEINRLQEAIEQAVGDAEGEIGVAVKHYETGVEVQINGNTAYPMASTFKLPILVELFNQVDEGKIRLDEMISLGPEQLHLGSGQLKRFVVPGVQLSIENLVHLMMRISDNSATDMLLERVGADNVNRRLADLGITGISVNRSCQKLILDWLGFDIEKTRGLSYEEIETLLNEYQPEPGEQEEAADRFADDPQDTATPRAMNLLLEKVLRGEAAKPESCWKILDILLKCETGRERIRGLLPPDLDVAHKTGTIGGTVNNVGIIYLPHELGRVVISVLSKRMKDREEAERVIAHVARYAYDYFLFTTPQEAVGNGNPSSSPRSW